MATNESRIILVDDLRSFVDDRSARVARTSAAGVELLDRCRDQRLDELWLDHDLGEDDTIWPVVAVLERAAFDGRPFDVGIINIHSANPAGATKMAQVLRHWELPGPHRIELCGRRLPRPAHSDEVTGNRTQRNRLPTTEHFMRHE